MKKNLLLLLTLVSAFANGQITLTHSDYQSAFSIGTVYQTLSTPIGGEQFEIFVGEPSASPQIWDLTDLPLDYLAISRSIQPSTAPFIGDFPSCNLVLYEKYWFGPGDTLYSWNYKELQSDKLLLHGQSDESSVYMSWDPAAIQAVFPMTLGTSWIGERDSTSYTPEIYTISENIMTIDAFGTLVITTGEFPCLRLRMDHLTIAHTPVGIDTSRTRSFNLYTQGMIEVHLGTIDEGQFDLPIIWTSGVKLSGRQGSVGISPVEPPSTAMIKGIYPNPVADVTKIAFTLKQSSEVTIQLTNLSGKEVAVICNVDLSAGEHKVVVDVSAIPSGIYFCRLEANGRVETRKLVICR